MANPFCDSALDLLGLQLENAFPIFVSDASFYTMAALVPIFPCYILTKHIVTNAYKLFKNYQKSAKLQGHYSHHHIFVGGRQVGEIITQIPSSPPIPGFWEEVF